MGAKHLKARTRYGKRECFHCKAWKPLSAYPRLKVGICRDCSNAVKRQLYAEKRLKLPPRAVARAKRQANKEANRERENAHAREYRRQIKADPERHARMLEMARLRWSLEQERKGRDLSSIRHLKSTMVPVPRYIAVDTLRAAFERSSLSPNELALRMGWKRTNGKTGGEGSRVLRLLGLVPAGHRNDREEAGPKREIAYDVAVRMVKALDLDGVDVGV